MRALRGLIDLTAEGGEAGPVEDARGGVPDFLHGEMNPTDRLVPAVGTCDVGGLAGAGDWGKRPIEHANDLPEIDLRWIAREQISASLPLPAAQNPLVAQSQENQLEKFGGDLLGPSQIGDTHRLIAGAVGEREERLDGVLGFSGEHARTG